MQGRLWPTNQREIERATSMGLGDVTRKLTMDDLVRVMMSYLLLQELPMVNSLRASDIPV